MNRPSDVEKAFLAKELTHTKAWDSESPGMGVRRRKSTLKVGRTSFLHFSNTDMSSVKTIIVPIS